MLNPGGGPLAAAPLEDQMLSERRAHTTLPVADVDRARVFWEETLGFRPFEIRPGAALYRAGDGSVFALSRSGSRAGGATTQMAFTVPDVEAEVAELKTRGVVFEEYDLPGLKTEGGIARIGPGRAAWFFDPEGNLIGVVEFDPLA
jgi:catechol 2,3-dioxygenase-like lactoylglutathione lyase family enzyme